jgi:hypothetical protein
MNLRRLSTLPRWSLPFSLHLRYILCICFRSVRWLLVIPGVTASSACSSVVVATLSSSSFADRRGHVFVIQANSSADVSDSTISSLIVEVNNPASRDDPKDADAMHRSAALLFAASINSSLLSYAQPLDFRYTVAPFRNVSILPVIPHVLMDRRHGAKSHPLSPAASSSLMPLSASRRYFTVCFLFGRLSFARTFPSEAELSKVPG